MTAPIHPRRFPRGPNGRATEAWRAHNKAALRARGAMAQAIKTGKMPVPPGCERCGRECVRGQGGLHGHHEDYSRPLDVIWLCHSCHRRRHHEIEQELRAADPEYRRVMQAEDARIADRKRAIYRARRPRVWAKREAKAAAREAARTNHQHE